MHRTHMRTIAGTACAIWPCAMSWRFGCHLKGLAIVHGRMAFTFGLSLLFSLSLGQRVKWYCNAVVIMSVSIESPLGRFRANGASCWIRMHRMK